MCNHEKYQVIREEYTVAICEECGKYIVNPLAPLGDVGEMEPVEEITIF